MILVTKPFLPPSHEYQVYLEGIWQRNHLTNNGPLVLELEKKLMEYLGMPNLLYLSNGTIAIQIAIKALGLKGEIITTPFSYVATTSSIVWEGCTPVFADINPTTFNLDPARIEEAITPRTSAILATHVYGNPCDVEAIDTIAKRHNLKVIYDAAHGFGTKYKGKSIYCYGDVSTASFHATKLFHTIEGGAVFTHDPDLLKRMDYMRNFGHDGPEKFNGVGINGKNSEFHAAMGLVNLNYVDQILQVRKDQSVRYDQLLKDLPLQRLNLQPGAEFNYAYYPVIFRSEDILLKAKAALEQHDISSRRYFYPSLSGLNYVKSKPLTVADDIARRILCLPIYHSLTCDEQKKVADTLFQSMVH